MTALPAILSCSYEPFSFKMLSKWMGPLLRMHWNGHIIADLERSLRNRPITMVSQIRTMPREGWTGTKLGKGKEGAAR